jgi:hypothetical protein
MPRTDKGVPGYTPVRHVLDEGLVEAEMEARVRKDAGIFAIGRP